MNLFYITDIFPCVSQVFISREVSFLERMGARVSILSLHKPQDKIVHEVDQNIRARQFYGQDLSSNKGLKAFYHLRSFVCNPIKYLVSVKCSTTPGLPYMKYAFRQSPSYCKIVRDSGAVRIHCHFGRQGMLVGWLASRMLGIPFSVTLHGSDVLVDPYERLDLVLKDADLVICASDKIRNIIHSSYNVPSTKTHVIRCGIIPHSFPYSQQLPGTLKILSVARLHSVKGLPYLIEACAILRDRNIDFECTIVGEGAERATLEEMILRNRLGSSVKLTGALPNEKLPLIYADHSIFVLPSLSEGLPVVLIEAMATGLPVVATEVGGIPEIVQDGVNGILGKPQSAQEIADAIEYLNLLNDKEQEKMRRRNRVKVEKFFNANIEIKKLHFLFQESM